MTLRDYRKAKGLTLDQFGTLIGRTAATVSRYESGDLWPSRKTLQRIEEITQGEVTATDLLARVAA